VRTLAFAAIGVLSFGATAQAGAPLPEPIHLVYRAPADCVDEATFVEAVHARTALVRFTASEQGRTFDVEIRAEGPLFKGQLRTVDADEHPSQRGFQTGSCGELTSALALLIALAVDPHASADAAPPPPPRVYPPLAPDRPAAGDVSSPAPERHVAAEAGASVFLLGGVTPVPLVGAGVLAGLADVRSSAWSPALRLGASFGSTTVVGPSFDRAAFAWVAGRVEGCPSRWNAGSFSLWPCAETDVGELRARGIQVMVGETRGVTWWSVGGLLRARWTPRPQLFAEVVLGAAASLTRPIFAFETPYRQVFQPDAAIAHGALALGATFP
jgi:hypothetical protein